MDRWITEDDDGVDTVRMPAIAQAELIAVATPDTDDRPTVRMRAIEDDEPAPERLASGTDPALPAADSAALARCEEGADVAHGRRAPRRGETLLPRPPDATPSHAARTTLVILALLALQILALAG